jgi:hypothetical protein
VRDELAEFLPRIAGQLRIALGKSGPAIEPPLRPAIQPRGSDLPEKG